MSNTTTGSDRVVHGQQPPEEQGSRLARFTRPAVRHWQFGVVLAAAIAVRIIVILGYPPILWFNDSYNYVYDAVTHIPDTIRPNGYPFFIDLLLPLHSAYPLAVRLIAERRVRVEDGRVRITGAAGPSEAGWLNPVG